jgi:hypothetical protein
MKEKNVKLSKGKAGSCFGSMTWQGITLSGSEYKKNTGIHYMGNACALFIG